MTPSSFVPRPAEGLRVPSAVHMFAERVAASAHRPALRWREAGVWRSATWREWSREAAEIAAGLLSLGIRRGDRVAIAAESSPRWAIADVAIAMAGAVSVPVFPGIASDHLLHVLTDSAAVAAFVDHPARLVPAADVVAKMRAVLGLDDETRVGTPLPTPWSALRRRGTQLPDRELALSTALRALGPEDPWSIVYTSGTSGLPKGAVLAHKNVVYESWAIKNVVPVDDSDEQLLALPLAHIFARHLLWGAIEQGVVTSFGGESRPWRDLAEVAPTYVAVVPAMLEQLQARIEEDMAKNPLLRTGFAAAREIGQRMSALRQRGRSAPASLLIRHALAERAVLGRIRSALGGRLRFFVSGGAPLPAELAAWFHSCGVLVLEGYGLTETCGAVAVNRPDRFRFGTVGPPLPGCEIRLSGEGEVLVRGHGVMTGYHGLPAETASTFDDHGWLRTGDLGEIEDGFLRIGGRIKDLVKTASGRTVAPQRLEERLESCLGIARAVVLGEGRHTLVALIELDEPELMALSEHEGLGCRSYGDLAEHPRIRRAIQSQIDAVNAAVARWEAIRAFAALPRPLRADAGELTPTGKVRRAAVAEHFAALVARLWEDMAGPGGLDARGARA
jgi:long-chain acyl-CoA synthetase